MAQHDYVFNTHNTVCVCHNKNINLNTKAFMKMYNNQFYEMNFLFHSTNKKLIFIAKILIFNPNTNQINI